MIDKRLLQKNKKQLLAQQKRLQQLLRGIAPEYPELGSKDDENAAEVEQYERNLTEERELRDQLTKIEAALKRLASGTYGICTVGGEEISTRRLQAAPEADTCVEHGK